MPASHRHAWYTLLTIGCISGAAAAQDLDAVREHMEEALRRSFPNATSEQWKTRIEQDRTQARCSQYRNAPPAQIAATISEEAKSTMRYPDGGKLVGDWRKGEQIALISGGGQLSRLTPDPAGSKRGGNCYACHALASQEVAAGNLGPSLTHYGKVRGTSNESARYTYEKIYNAQAYLACSFMPRFGHNGWLTPDEVADVVAYLLDPESPVNR